MAAPQGVTISEIQQILNSAKREILSLRKRHEIQSAQLAIVDVFAAACGLRREEMPQTIDVVWEIDKAVGRIDAALHEDK